MADDKTTPDVEGQTGDAGQTDGKADADGDDGSIVFDNQDALNAFVARRLRRDRKTRKAVDTAIDSADDTSGDKSGDKSASPAQTQIHADATALIEQAQRTAVEANALVAATEAGLPADRIRAAVKLADLSVDEMIDDNGEVDAGAVRSAINDATKTYSFLKVADDAPATDSDDAPAPKVGGKTPKPDGDKALDGVTAERFREMGYQERVQLYNRDPQLYERLSAAVA